MSEDSVTYGGQIENAIYLMRGHRVMLSSDLARLYQVEPRALMQAVKRNIKRFPVDFMFPLQPQEVARLRSQIVILDGASNQSSRPQNVTLNRRGSHAKYPPYAFTEQGVAMLSSVLNSERAIQVNVAIMRAFVKLRETLSAHKDLAAKLAELERKIENHDESIHTLFEAIRQLMTPPAEPPRKEIGFQVRETGVPYRIKRRPVRAGAGKGGAA